MRFVIIMLLTQTLNFYLEIYSMSCRILNHKEKRLAVEILKKMKDLLCKVNSINKSPAIHAIGNRTIDQVVNLLRKMKKNTSNIPEIRIEYSSFKLKYC
jgi:hypothetical protein